MYKRNGIYWQSFTDIHGERQYMTSGLRDAKKAASFFELITLSQRGILNRIELFSKIDKLMGWHNHSYTVSDIWDLYLKTRPDIHTKEHSERRSRIDAMMDYFPHQLEISDIRPRQAQEFCEVCLNIDTTKAKTYNNKVGMITSLFERIAGQADLLVNPFAKVLPLPEVDSITGRDLNDQEIMDLLKICFNAGEEQYEATMISLHTGFRKGDVLSLKKENIIDDFLVKFSNKTRKHKVIACIPIHDNIREILDNAVSKGNTLLFEEASLSKISYPSLMRLAKIPPLDSYLSFHLLRHTFASHCQHAGIDNESIGRWGAWTKKSTQSIYMHDIPQEDKNIITKLYIPQITMVA